MQHEILNITAVPAPDGLIKEPGWARTEVMQYTRQNIHAPWYRKKEWDYYLVNNDAYAAAFTISDLGYVGLLSASLIDLKAGTEITRSEIAVMPKGKAFHLGTTTSDANASCSTKNLRMQFANTPMGRHISCVFQNFSEGQTLKADLQIKEPGKEGLYICTPWKEKESAFYYNCKKNCLLVEGYVTLGDLQIRFDPAFSAGVLDWGRGVWTYDNTWYWGTGSGFVNGHSFGFNLGYGFTDRSSCSENALFYDGKLHKLSEVEFQIPESEAGKLYTNQWKITSDDGRFEAVFDPIVDRFANMDFKVIVSTQHQVFGKMTGFAVLDDGKKIEFHDFICAIEEVRNKY